MSELLTQVRSDLDDPEFPGGGDDTDSRWSNAELTSYLNRAIDEACLRSRLIVDTAGTDANLVPYGVITTVAGQAEYTLDPRVMEIRRAIISGENDPLCQVGWDDLDDRRMAWPTEKEDKPLYYLQDLDDRTVIFHPTPNDIYTIELTVQRTQLQPFRYPQDLNRAPEIAAVHQWNLVYWIEHLAYLKRDPDVYDQDRSKEMEQRFNQFFGERYTAREYNHLRRTRPMRARSYWL